MNARIAIAAVACGLLVLGTSVGCQNSQDSPSLNIPAGSEGSSDSGQASSTGEDGPINEASADPQIAGAARWLTGAWNGTVRLNREALTNAKTLTEQDIRSIESARMALSFSPRGKMAMSAEVATPAGPRGRKTNASWKVLRVEGADVTVQTHEKDHPAEIVTITRRGDHAFTMPAPQNVGVTEFRRARK